MSRYGIPTTGLRGLVLRLFLDLDTARTAEVLGIEPSTVKAHLARAVASLRDLIPTPYEEIPS